jgi:hypothetical protein
MGKQVSDYQISPNGTMVKLMNERASQRGTIPKPPGFSFAFRTRHETMQFVEAGEAEGFIFEREKSF